MLAYVFWHAPVSVVDVDTYETALAAFHSNLDSDIPGFRGSRACLVDGAPWVSAPVVYEDWYLVDDFTALGALNEAAVAGHRRWPHDNVAHLADKGTAGVFALCGGDQLADATRAAWFGKPGGMAYDEFYDQLGERTSLWRRQMVLGPTPEFCSMDDDGDVPAGAVTVTLIRTVATSAA